MKKTVYGLFLLMFILFSSCSEDVIIDDEPGKKEETKDEKAKKWIESTLRDQYLFYEDMPEKTNLSLDTEDFFNSLLSDKDGKTRNGSHYYYSYLEEYTPDTKASSQSDSYGFEFASLPSDAGDYYFVWVLYVLPNSPAEEAGLKRGDWILGINDDVKNISNLNVLLSGSAKQFTIGSYDEVTGTFRVEKNLSIPAARQVENTPFLCDTTFHKDGRTIGYMLYNHFTVGLDDYDMNETTYDNLMIEKMRNFQNQGVTEFVLDLRYNGGGNIISAQKLATMLAPQSALDKVFCILEGNNKQHEKTSYWLEKNEVGGVNLNLSHLYVLVSSSTASASELVVNALIPYMGRENITLIGTQTEGKNVGSLTIGIDSDYGYLLHPITFYVFNKERKADYANGFPADIEIEELIVGETLYPFGNERDAMLNAALRKITNKPLRTRSIANKQLPSNQKVSYTPRIRGLYTR